MNELTINNELLVDKAAPELERHLTALVGDLHPELLKRAIRSAYGRAAVKLRTEARNLFATLVPGLGHRADRAIDYKVHRDLSGFRVRVRYSGQKAMLRNRRGLEKPLPHFLDVSTDPAKNPGGRRTHNGLRRSRAAHFTGNIVGAEVMPRIEAHHSTDEIDKTFTEAIEAASARILKKYGL